MMNDEEYYESGRRRYSLNAQDDEPVEGMDPEPSEKKTKVLMESPIVAPTNLDSFSTEVEQKVSKVDEVSAEPQAEELPSTSQMISLSHQVKHEVAIPKDFTGYIPLAQHKPHHPPVREFPFELDPFQKLSIYCIQRNESVLVSAHTSAGKTVVAEYAIATALKAKQRVIYTSPIKALSNQKYREMQERFTDVGLMTGDVTLNQEASCLVMTTEILRSMLYRGSEIMREVSWVIFDEIHYMRDKERGVVWEETIILLPHTVRFVFLSATIPNSMQFARWICQLHHQPCHVVYTNYRPTPLQHYLFPSNAEGIFLVVDEKGTFREESFRRALNVFSASTSGQKMTRSDGSMDIKLMPVLGRDSGKKRRGNNAIIGQVIERDLSKLIKMITNKQYYPVIVFSFSKRECEKYALALANLDLNTPDEKVLVEQVFSSAMVGLSEEDRQLPQIASILPLLQRGLGIHHSGLLPILKEVIEILFQEGLLKVLFATETFSIGLNMPAKTVVFTNTRKFDGSDHRWLSSGEYIQMSGRAGRRGLDTRGIVILMAQEQLPPEVAKNMLKGQPDALNSAFHLSYNMILNLLRVEGVPPEAMLARSFFQFQSGESIPDLEERHHDILKKIATFVIPDEEVVQEYCDIQEQLRRAQVEYRRIVQHPSHVVPFLQVGRLVRIVCDGTDYGWCAVANVFSRPNKANTGTLHTVDVLAKALIEDPSQPPVPAPSGDNVIMMPILLDVIQDISSIRVSMPKDLRPPEQRRLVWRAIQAVHAKYPKAGEIPKLHPMHDMKIRDEAFLKLAHQIEVLQGRLLVHAFGKHPDRDAILDMYRQKSQWQMEAVRLAKQLRSANSILQMEEMKCRKRILRRLDYVSDGDVMAIKGRVACEISTGDELLLTELMFAGMFRELGCDQLAALLSCFVFQEKGDMAPLRPELADPLKSTQELAKRLCKLFQECRLPGAPSEEEYLSQLRPELMEVVWQWCRGAKFAKICKLTEIFEGSIIRCMRRLEELLRQMAAAAKTIGNDELEAKFNDTIALLKRDIVFANSLYL